MDAAKDNVAYIEVRFAPMLSTNKGLTCKEVIENLGSEFDVPIFVTTVYDESARSLTGTNIETMTTILEGLGVDALGMNCSLGPIQMKEFIKDFIEK